jgi:hypothetical protein
VESLHRLYITWGERVPYIQYGGFLRELVEFGFEIMRVKPTTTVGSNPAAEWIENLLEGNGSEGSLKLAAEGLAQMFDGFKLNADAASMYEVGNALDYMGRLVQVAEAVDDVKLDQEVLKASTLSHLVNLGGAYAALNPTYQTSSKFFLNILQNVENGNSSIADVANELEVFYLSHEFPLKVIQHIRSALIRLLPSEHEVSLESSRDSKLINRMIQMIEIYSSFHNDVNTIYPENVIQTLEFLGYEQEIEEFEASSTGVVVASLPTQGSNLISYASPLDLLDYLGLGITVLERLYIEIGMKPGQEKEFAKFVNTLYLAIDAAMAALPGAGGGGLAARASHELAVAGWNSLPSSLKQKVIERVAKDLGWTLVNTNKAVNAFFSSQRDPNAQINSASKIPKRQTPRMEDGNSREGWEHIDGRHVSGNHPNGAGDLFPSGTTRAILEAAAKKIVLKGTRLTEAGRRIVTYEGRVKILKKNLVVRVTVDSQDGNRIITMFPVGR